MRKPGFVVLGLVLFIDGVGLVALSLGADLVGIGKGYGPGPKQVLGVSAGILLSAAGLAVLLREALGQDGKPGNGAPPEG